MTRIREFLRARVWHIIITRATKPKYFLFIMAAIALSPRLRHHPARFRNGTLRPFSTPHASRAPSSSSVAPSRRTYSHRGRILHRTRYIILYNAVCWHTRRRRPKVTFVYTAEGLFCATTSCHRTLLAFTVRLYGKRVRELVPRVESYISSRLVFCRKTYYRG